MSHGRRSHASKKSHAPCAAPIPPVTLVEEIRAVCRETPNPSISSGKRGGCVFRNTSGFGLSISREFARNKNPIEINGSLSAM